jgi:hypothetical protein
MLMISVAATIAHYRQGGTLHFSHFGVTRISLREPAATLRKPSAILCS